MKKTVILFALLAAVCASARDTNKYDRVETRDGITFSQRGGLGTSNEVVTAVNVPAVISSTTNSDNFIVFSNAVAAVTPPIEQRAETDPNVSSWARKIGNDDAPKPVPDYVSLSSVTNSSGSTVSAVNVGAFPLTAFVEEYTTAHAWSYGDYCLHGGKLWIAVDNTQQGRKWDPDRWEESTDYTTPLEKWISKAYVDLGPGGTNLYDLVRSIFIKKINVGIDTESKYRYLWLTPQYIGLENADQTKYVRVSPASVEYKDGSGTWSTLNWGNIRTTANASPIDASSIDPDKTYLYTSPYHVWSYLQAQGYLTPSAGDLRYVAKGSDVTASKVGDDYHWQDADGRFYYRPTTFTQGSYTYTQKSEYWWTDESTVGQTVDYHIEYDVDAKMWRSVLIAHSGSSTITNRSSAVSGSYTNASFTIANRTYVRSAPSTVVKAKRVAYLSDLSGYALSSSIKPFAIDDSVKIVASDVAAGTFLPNSSTDLVTNDQFTAAVTQVSPPVDSVGKLAYPAVSKIMYIDGSANIWRIPDSNTFWKADLVSTGVSYSFYYDSSTGRWTTPDAVTGSYRCSIGYQSGSSTRRWAAYRGTSVMGEFFVRGEPTDCELAGPLGKTSYGIVFTNAVRYPVSGAEYVLIDSLCRTSSVDTNVMNYGVTMLEDVVGEERTAFVPINPKIGLPSGWQIPGSYAFGTSAYSKPTGAASVALGHSVSSGSSSIAGGNDATASGVQSVAIGSGAAASGNSSLALGPGANAAGPGAIALGYNATATNNGAVVIVAWGNAPYTSWTKGSKGDGTILISPYCNPGDEDKYVYLNDMTLRDVVDALLGRTVFTNAVKECAAPIVWQYSALRYDPGLNVTWTNIVNNGHAYYVTITNANVATP